MTNAKCLDNSREGSMNASDIMTTDVTTAKPNTRVQEVAEVLVTKRISGMPVVDESSKVVGMISEGDLLRRSPEGAWPKVGDRPLTGVG
jgi:CBS domain-containing protein